MLKTHSNNVYASTSPSVVSVVCSSPLVPVVRGEVGEGYCHPFFVFYFLSLLFCHCVLYRQSLTPSIFCCCSPFFSHSYQIFLMAVLPSHHRSSSFPFPSTFWASARFTNFSSSILSTCRDHFSLHITSFFLRRSSTLSLLCLQTFCRFQAIGVRKSSPLNTFPYHRSLVTSVRFTSVYI